MPSAIRALAHRDFRLYFAGQAISILGSWIQQVALSWLVYRLTGSAALLGITAFCALVPQLLVGPLAGAWIDKHDKRRWLIGVQALLALQAFLLALLTWQGWIGSQGKEGSLQSRHITGGANPTIVAVLDNIGLAIFARDNRCQAGSFIVQQL